MSGISDAHPGRVVWDRDTAEAVAVMVESGEAAATIDGLRVEREADWHGQLCREGE